MVGGGWRDLVVDELSWFEGRELEYEPRGLWNFFERAALGLG